MEASYLALDGTTQTVSAREVSTSMQRLDADWWVMRGGMKTATQRMDVAGEVNLILAKDAYFCADAGIGGSENGGLFSNPYAFDEPVTEGMTLYAVWVAASRQHLVVFDSNGGTDVASQEVADGERATRPADPTREGYRFVGWYSDVEQTRSYDFSASVSAGLTLYAKWEKSNKPVPPPTTGTITGKVSLGDGVGTLVAASRRC